jgi:hypothetical protein
MPAWGTAQQSMHQVQEGRCGRDVPGDTHRSLNVNNSFSHVTFKHVLLPIWIAAYRYNGKPYQFLVNGQTGEVVGKAPWSTGLSMLLAVDGALDAGLFGAGLDPTRIAAIVAGHNINFNYQYENRLRFAEEPDFRARFAQEARITGGIESEHIVEVVDARGRLAGLSVFKNLITKVGDNWYAERAARILGSATNITSSTNASPIVITATAHGLGTGDTVIVAGHSTNTNAVGTWNISAVGTNTITLQGTTGNGVGGATGTVQGFTLPYVTGMKLGTGTTGVAKSGAGSAIVTYVGSLTASKALDANYPASTRDVPGCQIAYKTTWNAGEATSGTNWGEVVLTNQTALADDAGSAANTISRALISPTQAKLAGDVMSITWNQIALGA